MKAEKQIVRLTESQFSKIVRESVRRTILETIRLGKMALNECGGSSSGCGGGSSRSSSGCGGGRRSGGCGGGSRSSGGCGYTGRSRSTC